MLGDTHGKVTPTALGNQLPGSSLPSQVPSSVLAGRERRAKRPALESDGSGFKSKPQHSLDMFSGASDFLFLIFKMKVSAYTQGAQISASFSVSLHHLYPGLLSAPRCPLGKTGQVLGCQASQLLPLYILLPPTQGPKERTHSSPTGPRDLCSTGRLLGTAMELWSRNRRLGLRQPLP